MVNKAKELAKEHGYFETRQFEHEVRQTNKVPSITQFLTIVFHSMAQANAWYHANTTGPEILTDFVDKRLDAYVTGYGTGGTLQGVGKVCGQCLQKQVMLVMTSPVAPRLPTTTTGAACGAPRCQDCGV